MRLFLAAVTVVATFVVVALLISRLFPGGTGWAGVCVAITCLYASTFGVWVLLGNAPDKNARAIHGEIVEKQHPLRDNLLYFAVAMAVVTIVIALVIHDTERGMHRNFSCPTGLLVLGVRSLHWATPSKRSGFPVRTGVSGRPFRQH